MRFLSIALLCILSISSCSSAPKSNGAETNSTPKEKATNKVTHEAWDKLLSKHVDDKGFVDYKGFINDMKSFDAYLNNLSNNPPKDSWTDNEKKAFWINAYNAFTVKLITEHYPVESIKDIGSKIQIPFVNTPWQHKFFSIGGEKMKLDEIEHQILRKKFDDPRIHFALVCASYSCPRLLNEAYTADKLDKQLEMQAKYFLANKAKNNITANKLELSKYFDWYKGDFTKNTSLIGYLNKYAPVKINEGASISYKDYNWSLNEQK